MAELIWVVKKIRHIIEVMIKNVIIYTDYVISVRISHQFSLNITAVKKLNLYLIQTSKYLQYFHLNIYYKFKRSNIILDALSWLFSNNNIYEHLVNQKNQLKTDNFILKVLQINLRIIIYVKILIKVSDQLWQNIKYKYVKESKWECILQILERNNTLRFDAVKLLYEIRDNLIFYKDLEKEPHLCILKSLYDRMFKIVYDDIDYLKYA